MYFDIATKSYIPLCNKPNCQHDSEECNAFFNNYSIVGDVTYISNYIQYYDGYVYVIAVDEKSGYVYLYQISPDGSSSKEYMTLYKADLSSVNGEVDFHSPNVCIHRGYVYFIDNGESAPKIRRIEL